MAHREGVEDARRNERGGALKGFGESALWFPGPHSLINYAEAMQRFLGPIRRTRKDLATHLDSDLRRFESLYRSALASDAVLSVLSEHERRHVGADADCIAAYRRDRSGLDACAPLQRYGLRRD